MIAQLQTPLGPIAIDWCDGALVGVDLAPDPTPSQAAELPAVAAQQFLCYLADGRAPFDLPLRLSGTAFQKRVWALLQSIPAGETRTYGVLASELGTAPRAIGQACRTNPCPIVVPCHRVVARQGLGGFSGAASGPRLAFKRWLLDHERAQWPR